MCNGCLRYLKGWHNAHSLAQHRGGRIWVLWCPAIYEVTMLQTHTQFMHLQVYSKSLGKLFYVTVVYGSNKLAERKILWGKLKSVALGINLPWVVGGDFNNVLLSSERQGGCAVQLYEVVDYQHSVQDCGLTDMKWHGLSFTWSNKQKVDRKVYSKIDRVMVNDDWVKEFFAASTWFKAEIFSNHAFAIIHMALNRGVRHCTFRFCNTWALASHFNDIVRVGWSTPAFGDKMHRVMYQLKQLKQPLLALSRQQFPDVVHQLETAQSFLIAVQEQLGADKWNHELVQAEQQALQHYHFISTTTHLFIVQLYKAIWLQLGDDNTRYFHSLMRKQRYKRQITMIQSPKGDTLTDQLDIHEHFLGFYRAVLGTPVISEGVIDSQVISEGAVISVHQQIELICPFIAEDVHTAMFSISSHKSPMADGYGSEFFFFFFVF